MIPNGYADRRMSARTWNDPIHPTQDWVNFKINLNLLRREPRARRHTPLSDLMIPPLLPPHLHRQYWQKIKFCLPRRPKKARRP